MLCQVGGICTSRRVHFVFRSEAQDPPFIVNKCYSNVNSHLNTYLQWNPSISAPLWDNTKGLVQRGLHLKGVIDIRRSRLGQPVRFCKEGRWKFSKSTLILHIIGYSKNKKNTFKLFVLWRELQCIEGARNRGISLCFLLIVYVYIKII